jgi:hypothetical protein
MRRRHRRAARLWRPDDGPVSTAGAPTVAWGRLASYDAVSRAGWLFLLPLPGVDAHPSELPGVVGPVT